MNSAEVEAVVPDGPAVIAVSGGVVSEGGGGGGGLRGAVGIERVSARPHLLVIAVAVAVGVCPDGAGPKPPLAAVGEAVPVGIGASRIRRLEAAVFEERPVEDGATVDLAAVRQAVAVRVPIAGVRSNADLAAIGQAVLVGVRPPRVGARPVHLLAVVKAVSVGVAVLGLGVRGRTLETIAQTVAVAVLALRRMARGGHDKHGQDEGNAEGGEKRGAPGVQGVQGVPFPDCWAWASTSAP